MALVGGYEFEIEEITNGWTLIYGCPACVEYYPTLNALCDKLLRFVHQDSPLHRNTKQEADHEQQD